MSPRTIVVIVLALVFGLVAALLVHRVMSTPRETMTELGVDVVVAKADIMPGVELNDSLVTIKKYNKDLMPKDALVSTKETSERSARDIIYAGEPVTNKRLYPKGERGLMSRLEPGMRAYSAQVVDSAASVSGFILPESKVDVLVTLRGSGSGDEEENQPVTAMLLPKVTVLAVGSQTSVQQNTGRVEETKLRTVTFAVTPEEATKLELGSRMGTLHMVLRHPSDDGTPTVEPATMAAIRKASGISTKLVDPLGEGGSELDSRLAQLEERLKNESAIRIKALEERLAAYPSGPGAVASGDPKDTNRRTLMLVRGVDVQYADVTIPAQQQNPEVKAP